jgi:DNA polymerase III epsilon subunit-like protein
MSDNGKVYRVEEVAVRAHDRTSGDTTSPVRAHSSKRVKAVDVLPEKRRSELLHGLSQEAAAHKGERYPSPYQPELFLDSMDGIFLPHAKREVYGRYVPVERLDAAARDGLPPELEDYAFVLAGKRTLSPEEIEQFMFVVESVEESLLGEYTRRGFTLDEAEALALVGGEPPELTADDVAIWDDKWAAWEDKHRAVKFVDMSFTGGTYEYPIDETEFAVLDFETTAESVDNGDRIIEVGVTVINSKGEVLGRVNSLVYPGDGFDRIDAYSHVHKINQEDVMGAPRFNELYPDLADALSRRVIVAQNKKFEEKFLAAETARVTVERLALPSLCTVDLANRFIGDKVPNKKLGTMSNYFNVELGDRAHEALGDTNATAQMLVGYLDHLKANGITSLYAPVPVEDFPLRNLQGRQYPRSQGG